MLAGNGYYNQAPDIHGTKVAWQAFDPERPPEIRLLDLESGQVRTVAKGRNFGSGPSLSDQHVVWSTSWPCDVVVRGRDIDFTGVFARHLDTRRYMEAHRLRGADCLHLGEIGGHQRALLGAAGRYTPSSWIEDRELAANRTNQRTFRKTRPACC